MNRIIQHVGFCVQLLLLSKIFPMFIQLRTSISSPFYGQVIFRRVARTHFVYPFDSWWTWGYFHLSFPLGLTPCLSPSLTSFTGILSSKAVLQNWASLRITYFYLHHHRAMYCILCLTFFTNCSVFRAVRVSLCTFHTPFTAAAKFPRFTATRLSSLYLASDTHLHSLPSQ